jgi:hypothetical protein
LAQYIAASAVLHANDAWSYLSRSIQCLLAGDPHRALHLGYYAELRASMSLLAAAGIGIFDRKHFVVVAPNSTAKLESAAGTHAMAWNALEFWAQLPASGPLFANLVRPDARTLTDWFHPYGGSNALEAQARAWFLQWGMDLSALSKDQSARNESSYRPDGIPDNWALCSSTTIKFVQELWAALQPTPGSMFQEIDRHILRLALERHYRSVSGKDASSTDPAFITMVNRVTTAQGFAPTTEARWKNFLLRALIPNDLSIFTYSALKLGNSTTDHLAVLSRGLLLLRMASGSANSLIHQAGFHPTNLSFWWDAIGQARGLWPQNQPPAILADLWTDIEDTLDQVEASIAADPALVQSFDALRQNLAEHLHMLSSQERVGLWAICPS